MATDIYIYIYSFHSILIQRRLRAQSLQSKFECLGAHPQDTNKTKMMLSSRGTVAMRPLHPKQDRRKAQRRNTKNGRSYLSSCALYLARDARYDNQATRTQCVTALATLKQVAQRGAFASPCAATRDWPHSQRHPAHQLLQQIGMVRAARGWICTLKTCSARDLPHALWSRTDASRLGKKCHQ